jgi:hypothetical protein
LNQRKGAKKHTTQRFRLLGTITAQADNLLTEDAHFAPLPTQSVGLAGMACQPVVSDSMKSIALRTLVREPRKVKRWTHTGKPVQVTDRGEPLWILKV